MLYSYPNTLFCHSPPWSFLILNALHGEVATSIQGQVPNMSKSETLIILYRSRGAPVHTGNPQNIATCYCHRDPLATCPNFLQPLSEVNPVTSLHLQRRMSRSYTVQYITISLCKTFVNESVFPFVKLFMCWLSSYLLMASSCFLFLSFFSCRNVLFLSFLAWSKF